MQRTAVHQPTAARASEVWQQRHAGSERAWPECRLAGRSGKFGRVSIAVVTRRSEPHSNSGTHKDTAFISAVSALAGSVVGGLTSGFTNWLNQRAQMRANLVTHALSRREDLFRDFIIAASKAYGEALVS